MKRILVLVSFIALILLMGAYILSQKATIHSTDKPRVATTIFPVYDITRQIAGDSIEVELILPPGASPHTYDPGPSDIKKILNSDIVFRIGHGIDDWSIKISESAGIKKTVVVDRDIKLRTFTDDGISGTDPHYWLSGTNGILIAAQIRDELSILYPDKSSVFQTNFSDFEKSVLDVNSQIHNEFSGKKTHSIATFHNGWRYFADAYGLNIITTFEEYPGETPSPSYLKSFIETVKTNKISYIFTEPQFSPKQLEPIAADLGVQLLTIDPIGGTESTRTYTDLLLYNGFEISKAL